MLPWRRVKRHIWSKLNRKHTNLLLMWRQQKLKSQPWLSHPRHSGWMRRLNQLFGGPSPLPLPTSPFLWQPFVPACISRWLNSSPLPILSHGCKSKALRSDLSLCRFFSMSPLSLIYSPRYLWDFSVDSPSLLKFVHVCKGRCQCDECLEGQITEDRGINGH